MVDDGDTNDESGDCRSGRVVDEADGDGGRGTLTGSNGSVTEGSSISSDASIMLVVLRLRRGPCKNA